MYRVGTSTSEAVSQPLDSLHRQVACPGNAAAQATMARLVLAGLLLCGVSAGPSVEECLDLGFTDTLSCSQCAKMGEFVKDEALLADCKSCCVEDSDGATTYARAVLEVCS